MRFPLDIISDGDRQIGDADARRGVAVHQQIILTEAVFAGAILAETGFRAEAGRRRNERPVEVVARLQLAQELACGVGAVENLSRKFRRIKQLHAGGDVEAAGAADGEQIRHLRGFCGGKDGGVTDAEIATDVRVRPARIEGADHRIEPGELRGKIGSGNVGGDGSHVRRGKHLGGVARKRGNRVATRGELTDDGIANVTALAPITAKFITRS